VRGYTTSREVAFLQELAYCDHLLQIMGVGSWGHAQGRSGVVVSKWRKKGEIHSAECRTAADVRASEACSGRRKGGA